jgi:CheY-like chemotaxis protein
VSAPLLLVVEDDHDVREALTQLLRDAGYDVAWAVDGEEALRALRRGLQPAAILLDLMMPVMDGFEFRANQRSDPALAAIPVILMTADRAVAPEVRALDVAALLAKPARVDDLLDVVARVASRRAVS